LNARHPAPALLQVRLLKMEHYIGMWAAAAIDMHSREDLHVDFRPITAHWPQRPNLRYCLGLSINAYCAIKE
jgi:hypothetical protein